MDTNAKSSAFSAGSDRIPVGRPENAGDRQAYAKLTMTRYSVGRPENAGDRQVGRHHGEIEFPVGRPENGDATQPRRYTFKLYPNATQIAALERQGILLAELWNAALEQREIQWAQTCQRHPKGERKGLTAYDQTKELKEIRAADPEYAAISADTAALCLWALDDAFRAFFRRAKEAKAGADWFADAVERVKEKRSKKIAKAAARGRIARFSRTIFQEACGYPRYKSPTKIANKPKEIAIGDGSVVKRSPFITSGDCTIWYRDHPKGWRLHVAGKHWKLYAKGIPGLIKARGRFPTDPVDLRSMEIIRRDGSWLASIVARMPARRIGGANPIRINFDLIDEFARVEIRGIGPCGSGFDGGFPASNERKADDFHGHSNTSDAEASEVGAERRCVLLLVDEDHDAEASEVGAERRFTRLRCALIRDAEASEVEADAVQSEGDRRFKNGSYRWRQARRRAARLKAKQARQRREALHRWTTNIVRAAAEIEVIAPPIRESTKSARGTEKAPGAAVEPIAKLNRRVLDQAPALAIQMLKYKATEAAVPFVPIVPDEHPLAINHDLPAATKAVRKARRAIRKEEA